MADESLTQGGGFDSSSATEDTTFSDYLHPNKPLYARVDFFGMVADLGKSTIVAFVSLFAGMVLAVRQALSNVFQAVLSIFEDGSVALTDGINQVTRAASEAASGQLDAFGLFALPVGTTIALVTFGGILLAIYLFWGDG